MSSEALASGASAEVRPRLIRRISFAAIPIVLNVFAICGLNMATPTGNLGPRIGVAAAGVLLAACFYALQGRPRIQANSETVAVRNLFGSRTLRWDQIAAITYTGAAPWPHLQLADGEKVALQAIQRWDKDHAVSAARTLRQLHALHNSPVPAPAAASAADVGSSPQIGQP